MRTADFIQRRVWVTGRVQGVGFRMSTLSEARKLPSLCGYVQNLPDGRVEAVFAGKEGEVLQIIEWCKQGPRLAKVTALEVKEETFDPTLSPFQIT